MDIVTNSTTYTGLLDPETILVNILNGLGNIYQNIYYILIMSDTFGYIYYYSYGYEIGNSVMRLFYSPASELNKA